MQERSFDSIKYENFPLHHGIGPTWTVRPPMYNWSYQYFFVSAGSEDIASNKQILLLMLISNCQYLDIDIPIYIYTGIYCEISVYFIYWNIIITNICIQIPNYGYFMCPFTWTSVSMRNLYI